MSSTEMHSHALGVVDVLRRLKPEERAQMLSSYEPDMALAIFEQLDTTLQEELLDELPDTEVKQLIESLDPDDRVRLLDALPEAIADRLLSRLNRREMRLTRKLMSYPEESAGRIMNPEYLPVRDDLTAEEALALVHREGSSAGTIDALPVIDEDRCVVGLLSLSKLVLAEPFDRVGDLMVTPVPTVSPETDQEAVAHLIQKADLLAVPVVDENEHLLGLITVDDAMDILQSEREEDFALVSASEPLERPYFSTSPVGLARSRLVWLTLLAVAGVLTVNVLGAFENVLEQVIALSLFIPLLIGIGGNCGAQSATTVIRAMAIGDLVGRNPIMVVSREGLTGLILGTGVATLAFLPVMLIFEINLAITIALTLVSICTLATVVGSSMPLLARRFNIDPAVVSAPMVTTLVDASGLLVYFLIAMIVMGL